MLRVQNLTTEVPDFKVESLSISDHTVIIGPSGAGKTTLLRCIAGVADYKGEIYVDDKLKTTTGAKRGVSMAWQDSRLLPHLSVRKNIQLGGDMELFDIMVDLFKITELLDKMPHELSGGEAQRVNIIRAICSPSRIVLFDEPMQGIDPVIVRKTLKQILHELKKRDRIAVMVTHELYQVYGLFEKAVVVRRGRVVAYGDLQDLYDHPTTPWMANFFGPYTVLNEKDLKNFNHHVGEKPCMVRPEWFKIKIQPHMSPEDCNATVLATHWSGSSSKIVLVLDGTNKTLAVELYTDYEIRKGDRVYVNYKKSSSPHWVTSS